MLVIGDLKARDRLKPGDLVRVISPGCQCPVCTVLRLLSRRAADRHEGTVGRITTVAPAGLAGIDLYHLSGLTEGFYRDELELVSSAQVGAE